MFKKAGPGMLVAAAFVGPGTVTTCIRAGVDWKLGLLWALLLSILATLVLQEMAGRLGLTTREGIPGLIRGTIRRPVLKALLIGIILSAIVLGNTAYEAGNISGAVLGLEALAGPGWVAVYPFITGLLAFLLLWFGNYRSLEKVFTGLVLLMSLSFLLTAILTRPDPFEILRGLLIPDLNTGNLLTVVALIGTTVVPYNLFLYTSLVSEKWGSVTALGALRTDIGISVLVGGLVSMAFLVTAAGSATHTLQGVMDLAMGLEPLYGSLARYGLGIGLFAAGITSAITAPLAAAFVARQCFGWDADRKDWRFRMVWMLVLLIGVGTLSLDFRPLEIIFFAQVANGILLPVIAVFLWWAVNQPNLMKGNGNTRFQNVVTSLVLILVTGLGIWSIFRILST
ncbi:MAG: Nramp family divalent metal transporter [Robiginitalea sp.]|nr:Nramp family divalent metal transporter [Robiginitalea sp.]